MPFAKSRLLGIVLLAIGSLLVAAVSYALWRQGAVRPTILGVTLNVAPGAILLVAGAMIIAKPRRTIIAFWIAPLWVPLLLWGWAAVSLQPHPGIVLVVMAFAAYLAMLVVGLPTLLFIQARNWTGLRAATFAGAVMAVFVSYFGLVLVLLALDSPCACWSAFHEALAPKILSVSAGLGALVSATFWAVVRPDRSAAAHQV
jgi:hypothetical protein